MFDVDRYLERLQSLTYRQIIQPKVKTVIIYLLFWYCIVFSLPWNTKLHIRENVKAALFNNGDLCFIYEYIYIYIYIYSYIWTLYMLDLFIKLQNGKVLKLVHMTWCIEMELQKGKWNWYSNITTNFVKHCFCFMEGINTALKWYHDIWWHKQAQMLPRQMSHLSQHCRFIGWLIFSLSWGRFFSIFSLSVLSFAICTFGLRREKKH